MLLTSVMPVRQDLVDSHIFIQSRSILEGLAQHDCSAALAWCEENRTRLKRLKSKLEFKLRVQVGLPFHIVHDGTQLLPISPVPSRGAWDGFGQPLLWTVWSSTLLEHRAEQSTTGILRCSVGVCGVGEAGADARGYCILTQALGTLGWPVPGGAPAGTDRPSIQGGHNMRALRCALCRERVACLLRPVLQRPLPASQHASRVPAQGPPAG